jgi:MFS transporter, DHA1 family, multidrug resistance protein
MKMKPGEFISLSACTMVLTALGIDIMLPALKELRIHFQLPSQSTETAQIISFFFMGQVAQLFFGVLSDHLGRLPILKIGFPLYIIGGVAATFAPSLPLMLAARFIAGMGASAVLMTTIAGVRDRFAGDEMARVMSLVFSIFLFTPVLAPFLGKGILAIASWKAVFLAPPIFAVIVFVWSSLRLDESLPKEKRSPLEWKSTKKAVLGVLSNRVFLRYTAITTLLFTALSTYVANSEHIVGEIYGKPKLFAWLFASIGLLMSICSFLNSRLSYKYGARTSIKWLLVAYVIVGGVLLLYTVLAGDPPSMPVFFGCVALLMAINLAVEPNSSALAMEPMGNMAGMASAIYGTAFFFLGGAMGSVISRLMTKSVFPLVLGFFILGVIAVFLVLNDRRPINRRNGS